MSKGIAAKFYGTWRLLSNVAQSPDGQTLYPFGKNVQGRASFEPGRFSFQVFNPDQPKLASADPRDATEQELRAAFAGYLAYYGSFIVKEDEGTIVNHVEAASIPNWVGTDQVRYYRFEGNRLILRTPPIKRNGVDLVMTLTWERIA
jgi:Lipocalin-like domain